LRTWKHIGLFDDAPDESSLAAIPALVAVEDTTATLEHRARSYLDANCSQCHRPNAVGGYFDARFDTPLAHQGLINGRLVNAMEIPGSRVITPGDLSRSVLHLRANLLGDLQMPPIARNMVDTNAVMVLSEWINALAR
jgi:mono/diheme cytochrome c family protein